MIVKISFDDAPALHGERHEAASWGLWSATTRPLTLLLSNTHPVAPGMLIRAPFARPRRHADVARARRRGDRIMHPICPRRLLQCLSQLLPLSALSGRDTRVLDVGSLG